MANLSRIDKWLSENMKEFDMRIVELQWPSLIGLSGHDVSFEINVNGHKTRGRGSDKSKEIALYKAVSESIERLFVEAKIVNSSNGMAAHLDLNIAKSVAEQELWERDIFLASFHLRLPVKLINPPKPVLDFGIRQTLIKWGVDLNYYHIGSVNSLKVVMCIANGAKAEKYFGIIIGFGSHFDLETASTKASWECLRHVSYNLNNLEQELSLKDFERIEHPTIADHGRLALSKEYTLLFNEWLKNVKSEPFDFTTLTSETEFNILNLAMINGLENCPLRVVRAKNLNLQDLYVGLPSSKLNMDRLKNISKLIGIDFRINLLPHPMR